MMMTGGVLTVAYLVAGVLFIRSLGGLSKQETARRGNLSGIVGMAIAVMVTAAAWANQPGRVLGSDLGAIGLLAAALVIGGGIGVIATLAQVLVALGSTAGKEPKEVVGAFYRGSAVKFGVTVLLFVLALRGHKVYAAPMFSAYVATFLVYWVVLARSLSPAVERKKY